jgi:hypothetical protein
MQREMQRKGVLPQSTGGFTQALRNAEKDKEFNTETPNQKGTVICSFYAKTRGNGLLFGSFFGMKLLTELGEQDC